MNTDPYLLDCKGRKIEIGDVLRVKHFVTRHGRGLKQHWMYKLVVDKLVLGTEGPAPMPALKILSLQDPRKTPHHYYERLDGRLDDRIEIVSGITEDNGFLISFDERPKYRPAT